MTGYCNISYTVSILTVYQTLQYREGGGQFYVGKSIKISPRLILMGDSFTYYTGPTVQTSKAAHFEVMSN